MKKSIVAFSILILLFGYAHSLYSQEERPKLKTEIVTIKYVEPRYMERILQKYISRLGKLQLMPQTNKIIIEDTPEIVEKILALILELDVKPVDLQFTVDLVLGSSASESDATLDKSLRSDPVIKELRNLLKYKSFRSLDSSVIKVQDNNNSSQRMGGNGLSLRLTMNPRYIKEEKGDSFHVDLRLTQYQGFKPDGNERTLSLIDTTLTLKSGEKTVVGVSKLDARFVESEKREDKALILIISGKVIK